MKIDMSDHGRMDPRKWEIWYARVDFGSSPGGKVRPVLVMVPDARMPAVLEITSKASSRGDERVLIDDAITGLDPGSHVKACQQTRVPRDRFKNKMGYLPSRYRDAVTSAMRRCGEVCRGGGA